MAINETQAPKQPAQVPAPGTPGLSGLGTLAIGVVVVAALYFGREVFIPLVLAVLLSFVLAPVTNFLHRLRLGRVPSVILSVLLALALILGIGTVLGTQVADLAGNLPQYQATVQKKVAGLQQGVLGRTNLMVQKLTHQVQAASNQNTPSEAAAAATGNGEAQKAQLVRIQEADPSPLALAEKVLGPVVSPVTTIGIVLVVVIFILLQREDLRNRLIRLFGSSDLHRTTVAMDDAAGRLGTYFLAQLGLNAAFGLVIGVGLWLIGLPSPILWGALAALLRFVPYIGSAISALLPLALAAAVDPGWSMVAWTAALFVVAETLAGQVIEPLLYGHSTGLSPFAVIVSALFWSFLWGPIGLILATPFTVCLVVLGRHVESLEFLDVLLGDRPPLTPVENFYQRMLAGDPDEARDLGEEMLKERSLSSYYDEVALKGLQLAANDFARGVVTPAQLENIKESCKGLVEDFEHLPDTEPAIDPKAGSPADVPSLAEQMHPKNEAVPGQAPPIEQRSEIWRGDTPVLCIAGRGPLDEASSSILAQLLRKHGIGASVVPYEAVSRERIRTLDLSSVAMVCISYLDITGSPAHLRYLLQRLHQRRPDIRILVGLWPVGDKILSDAALGKEVGADVYVSSLREAVEACLKAVGEASEAPTVAAASALHLTLVP